MLTIPLTIAEWLAGGILLAATGLNLTNVIARYVFSSPIVSAEELLQYMNVWMVMLASAMVTQRNAHLRLDLTPRWTPAGVRRLVDGAVLLLAIGLTVYVIVQAVRTIVLLYGVQQRSITAGIPLFLMYISIPLGFTGGLLCLLQQFWLVIRGRPQDASQEPAIHDAGPEAPLACAAPRQMEGER